MRTAPALLICLVATLALTGCVPDDGPIVVDPEPSSSSSPIFESDEEALEAAEEAYGAYLAASDAVSASGGVDVSLLESHVTDAYLGTLVEEYEQFRTSGRRTVGPTTFDSFELQQYSDFDSEALVSVYLCLDVSEVRVLDAAGTDVTPVDRKVRLPLEVSMTAESTESVLVDTSDIWDGDDFCV